MTKPLQRRRVTTSSAALGSKEGLRVMTTGAALAHGGDCGEEAGAVHQRRGDIDRLASGARADLRLKRIERHRAWQAEGGRTEGRQHVPPARGSATSPPWAGRLCLRCTSGTCRPRTARSPSAIRRPPSGLRSSQNRPPPRRRWPRPSRLDGGREERGRFRRRRRRTAPPRRLNCRAGNRVRRRHSGS